MPTLTPFRSPALCLLLTLGLAGCGEAPTTVDTKPLVRPAKIFQVADPSLTALRNFPAEVEANTDSELAFRVSGQIIEFPVKAGNEVSRGQLLARLDPKDFKLRLDDAQARYDLAVSQFERAKTLLAKKLAPQSNFDEAKANLAVALSSLNTTKADLEYTYLRAPFDGTVARVMTQIHENIQAKQTILELQSRDRVDVSIQIPEDIISRVKKDSNYQPTVTFDSHPDEQFLVTVKEWDTQADPTTLTYKVVFSMPTPTSFNVLPGMTANIVIDLAQITDYDQQSFLLPVESVFSGEGSAAASGQRFVWKMDPQSFKVTRTEVTVGEIRSGGIVILDGIAPGDQIVAAGVHFLEDGMQVRPWDREGGL